MGYRKIFKEKMKLSIDGSRLSISNLILTEGAKRTNLVADVSAAGVTLNVANFVGIVDNDYLLVGEWGEPTAEIVQVNDASVDASITIGALAHDHYTDTPVTVIPCDSVEFSRAATLVDANDGGVVTQLGTDVPIMAFRKDTIYNDPTNTDGYGYARFKKTEATIAYSEYTVGVAYEGNAYNSVEEMAKDAVSLVGIEIGDADASEEQLLRDSNQAQNIITKMQDWVFELIEDVTSIGSTENEYKYALSALTYALKYPNSTQGIMNVKFGSKILKKQDWPRFEENLENAVLTTNSGGAAIGAITMTVADSNELADSGTVYVGENVITYTSKVDSTGVLSGIPASGAGSITATITAGDNVWQGMVPGTPTEYAIFNGHIYMNVPVKSDEAGKKIKIKYIKNLARFTDFSQTTDITFYDAIQFYVAYKIELRRGNLDEANDYKKSFFEIVGVNSGAYKMQLMDQLEYYDFGFDNDISDNRNNNSY